MANSAITKKLVTSRLELLHKYGLVHFDKVLVQLFDDVSEDLNRPKIYKLATDAWLRLSPSGEVNVESVKRAVYMDNAIAMQYHERLGVPLYHVDQTDIYQTELEAIAINRPVVVVPDKVDVNGAIMSYGVSPLQSFVVQTLEKFAPEGQASKPEIVDFLTSPYPDGGGWYKRTPNFINHVYALIDKLVNQGILLFDVNSENYQLANKSSTTKIR